MSQLLVLPTPLPTSSYALGQLVVNPFVTGPESISPSSAPECKKLVTESKYREAVSHDDEGRFVSRVSRKSAQGNVLHVSAENMTYTSLANPIKSFDTLSRDTNTHSFLHQMAQKKQPLYYVTGIQKLTKPSFKRSSKTESTTEDMATSLDEIVYAVELKRVRCRVGAVDAPHPLEDIDYDWSYYSLEELDTQLSVGLGRKLEARELRALAGIVCEEDYADEGYKSYGDEEESEGLDGF